MSQFVILTDSGCDLSAEVLKQWEAECLYLTFRFNDSEKQYAGNEMPSKEFFDKMRAGGVAKTAAVNVEEFSNAFRKALDAGQDMLYIGISSGISNTFNAGRLAAEQLKAEYPERAVIAFDSLSASAGLGLMVYLAAEKKKNGATLEETAALRSRLPLLHHTG